MKVLQTYHRNSDPKAPIHDARIELDDGTILVARVSDGYISWMNCWGRVNDLVQAGTLTEKCMGRNTWNHVNCYLNKELLGQIPSSSSVETTPASGPVAWKNELAKAEGSEMNRNRPNITLDHVKASMKYHGLEKLEDLKPEEFYIVSVKFFPGDKTTCPVCSADDQCAACQQFDINNANYKHYEIEVFYGTMPVLWCQAFTWEEAQEKADRASRSHRNNGYPAPVQNS